MKVSNPVRLGIAALVLYVLFRIEPTLPNMRELFYACLYFLGAAASIAFTFSLAERTVVSVGEYWAEKTFDACGITHADGRPCMLPDGHRHLEHATAWTLTESGTSEIRHRFDDTGDRLEQRAARGQLPKVTRGGEVAETTAAK